MCKLRLVTFDVVNTLIKVKGSPGCIYSAAAKTCGVDIHPEAINKIYNAVWWQKKHQHPNYGSCLGMTPNQWWEDFVKRVFVTAGYQGRVSRIIQISDTLYSSFAEGNHWAVMPHSIEVLEGLKERGLQIGVISNFDNRLSATLRKHDLLKYFDFVVTCVTAKYEKPDARIFKYALDIAKVDAEDTGHVGDDIKDDYYGASQAGIHSFLYDRTDKYDGVNLQDLGSNRGFLVHKMSDLLDIIDLKDEIVDQKKQQQKYRE